MYPPSSCAWRGKVKSTSRMTDTWTSIMWEIVSNIFTGKKLAGKARGELNKNCIFNISDDYCITMHPNHAIYESLILENLDSNSLKVTPSKNIPEAQCIECLSLISISVYRTSTRKIDIAFHKA